VQSSTQSSIHKQSSRQSSIQWSMQSSTQSSTINLHINTAINRAEAGHTGYFARFSTSSPTNFDACSTNVCSRKKLFS
jgi:hypothetical protein